MTIEIVNVYTSAWLI